jgi:hypothetical protein
MAPKLQPCCSVSPHCTSYTLASLEEVRQLVSRMLAGRGDGPLLEPLVRAALADMTEADFRGAPIDVACRAMATVHSSLHTLSLHLKQVERARAKSLS